MSSTRPFYIVLAATLVLTILGAVTGRSAQKNSETDPLAAPVARWSSMLASDTGTDRLWLDAKKGGQAALQQAQDALQHGYRVLALHRLVALEQMLAHPNIARICASTPSAVSRTVVVLSISPRSRASSGSGPPAYLPP